MNQRKSNDTRSPKNALRREVKERPHRIRQPGFVAPQLPTCVAEPPVGKNWVHEIKHDGYRIVAAISAGKVRLFTRSGQDWTARFAEIAAGLARLDVKSALLDGEAVALDDRGRSDFGLLQRGLQGEDAELAYYAFDLLELDGTDLRRLPLRERKLRLRRILRSAPTVIRYSADISDNGTEILRKASKLGIEGIVSKRSDKGYASGRTTSWLKIKSVGRDEFVIGGYRPSAVKGRKFSSLLVGEYAGDDLKYCGRVGTGFDELNMDNLARNLTRLERGSNPFSSIEREIARDARWVEPRLVAEIAYKERTAAGILRHPVFLGLRLDKSARDVQAAGARRQGRGVSRLPKRI